MATSKGTRSVTWKLLIMTTLLANVLKSARAFIPSRRREGLGSLSSIGRQSQRFQSVAGPARLRSSPASTYQRKQVQQPFRLFAQTAEKADAAANNVDGICTPPDFATEANEKYFEFARLEKSIYEWWEESGYFQPSADLKKKPYVIPMPPPNVTGYLHMGHAMFVALQDIMARFHRMRGKATLWLPGT
jgi:arginyl-tRNA synthetase